MFVGYNVRCTEQCSWMYVTSGFSIYQNLSTNSIPPTVYRYKNRSFFPLKCKKQLQRVPKIWTNISNNFL